MRDELGDGLGREKRMSEGQGGCSIKFKTEPDNPGCCRPHSELGTKFQESLNAKSLNVLGREITVPNAFLKCRLLPGNRLSPGRFWWARLLNLNL